LTPDTLQMYTQSLCTWSNPSSAL